MIYFNTFLHFLVLYGMFDSLSELNRKYNPFGISHKHNINIAPEFRFIFFGFLLICLL